MLLAETAERGSGAPRTDWISTFPPMPTTNPARYIAPTILAVVLNVFIYSSLLGLLMAVFSSASFLFSSLEHGCVTFLPPMEKQRVGGGSWPRSRRRAGSCPAPSRGVSWPRNEGSLLLCGGDVCAPWHKTRQSTKNAPNFLEIRDREVRRNREIRSSTSENSYSTHYGE